MSESPIDLAEIREGLISDDYIMRAARVNGGFWVGWCKKLLARVESLEQENKRMREALIEAKDVLHTEDHESILERVRAALGGKP